MSNNFTITRIFNAPRQLVWDVWTKPEHIEKWWGPRGYDGTGSKTDFRVGGQWHFPMHHDGNTIWATGFYEEITPIERIVFTDSFSDEEGNIKRASDYGMPKEWPEAIRISVDFEDLGDRTKQTLTTYFDSPEMLALAKEMQMDLGWNESLDKMAEVFDQRQLIMSRLIDAPQSLVWQAFSQPEHIIKWWGPKGFTNTFEKFDLREGGEWLFVMHGPDGTDYQNKVVFTKIIPGELLAYDHGTPSEGVMFKAQIRMEPQGDKTMVTLCMTFETQEARDEKIRAVGAIEGGMQTLGRLAELLAALQK